MAAVTWRDGAIVAVSLSFDDARPSQLDGVRILDDARIAATFYVLPMYMTGHDDEWRDVARRGHELGNHSSLHPCSLIEPFSVDNAVEDATPEGMAADIDRAQESIERRTGVVPETFAYPCGQTLVGRGDQRRSYLPVVAERFAAGRGYMGTSSNDIDDCDLAHVEAISMDNVAPDDLLALVDRTLAESSAGSRRWLVLAGHDIAVPGPGGGTDADPAQAVRADALTALCARLRTDPSLWSAPMASVAETIVSGDRSTRRETCT